MICDFPAGCVFKGTAVTAAAGGLALLGVPLVRGITEKIKEILIDVKFDVGIFESTLFFLLSEALQLQRSFGLLNECLPFGPVSDAVLPVCYFHP